MTGEGISEPSSDPTIMSAGAPSGVQAASINPADTTPPGAKTKTILEQQIAELRAREEAEQIEATRLARDRYWQGRISQYAPRPAPSLEFLVTPTMESREGAGGIDIGANVIGAGVAGVTDWLNVESQRVSSAEQDRLQTMAAVNAARSMQLFDMRAAFATAVGEGKTPEETRAATGAPESMGYLATEWSRQYAADLERAKREAETEVALKVAKQFEVPIESAFATVEMHPEIQPYEYRYGPGAQGRTGGAPRPELTSGLDLYLRSISPEGKPAEFDPRLAAMESGKRATDYLKVMRGEIAAHPGLYPEVYTTAALEYGREAGGFESSIFRWAETPHKINYWTGRLQETAPEMPVALAGIIAGEKFKASTPTPAAESIFTWAKEGGKGLLPATFPTFTKEMAAGGEEPQLYENKLLQWGYEFTSKAVGEKTGISVPSIWQYPAGRFPSEVKARKAGTLQAPGEGADFIKWLGGSTKIPTNPRWYLEQVPHQVSEYQKGLYELRTDTSPEATAQKMLMMAGLGFGIAAAFEGAGAVGEILGISSKSPGLTGYAVTAAKYGLPLIMGGLMAARVAASPKPLKELTGIIGTELIPMGVGAGIWEGLPVKPGVEVSEFPTGARSTQYGIRTVKGAQGITPLSVAEVESFNFKDFYGSAGKALQRPEPQMETFTGLISKTTGPISTTEPVYPEEIRLVREMGLLTKESGYAYSLKTGEQLNIGMNRGFTEVEFTNLVEFAGKEPIAVGHTHPPNIPIKMEGGTMAAELPRPSIGDIGAWEQLRAKGVNIREMRITGPESIVSIRMTGEKLPSGMDFAYSEVWGLEMERGVPELEASVTALRAISNAQPAGQQLAISVIPLEKGPGWQLGSPKLTWEQVAGPADIITIEGTGPGTTNILRNLRPEDVAKWDLGLKIRGQTIGAAVEPGALRPVFIEMVTSHGLPNQPRVAQAMIDVMKADIAMGEEGYLYGTSIQRAAAKTVGEPGLGYTPRDADWMTPQAEGVFQTKMVTEMNRAAGVPAVKAEGTGIVSGKGKIFDIHEMQAAIKGGPGVSPPVTEEYLGLGLRPGGRVTSEEGLNVITLSEQTSRKFRGATWTISREPRNMIDLSGQILPEQPGRIKDIGGYYFAEQANIRGLELQGKPTTGVRANLETWLDLWGEYRAGEVRAEYTTRVSGGGIPIPPVLASPRSTHGTPGFEIFAPAAESSMAAGLFGSLIGTRSRSMSPSILLEPSPSLGMFSPPSRRGSRPVSPSVTISTPISPWISPPISSPRSPSISPLLSPLVSPPLSPLRSPPLSPLRSPPGYPPYSPILGSPSSAPSPLSPVYSPPSSPPRYSPLYSPPPYKSPPYSPPYSPPIPPRTPPGPPPPTGIFFGREDRGERPAREEYINFMQELAPTASFEEAFTAFKPPPRAPLPLVSKRWNIREGDFGLLPTRQPARLVGMMSAQRIEQPSGLLFEGSGRVVPRVKNAPFFPGLIGPHPGVKGKRRKNRPFEGLL